MSIRTNDVPTAAAPAHDLSTLTLDNNAPESPSAHTDDPGRPHGNARQLLQPINLRPDSQRSVTDPTPTLFLQTYFTNPRPSSSHRNRSPYSRSHLRSRSTGAALTAPVMTRAHSSPAVHTVASRPFDTSTLSSASPMRSPARQRSPFRAQEELSNYHPPPRSPSCFDGPGGAIESIQEDSELDLTPRASLVLPLSATTPFSRSSSLRRRPASPLHSVTNAAAPTTSLPAAAVDHNPPPHGTSVTPLGGNSPYLGPHRYNEAYPTLHHYASSSSFGSIPSTPTSQRSRSPSISSLDTIEDVPDLESEAIESERIERLKLAAERAERAERGEDVDDSPRRRSSFESGKGFGFGRGGSSRERKRWSVCGGERRVDLDLDTIWED